MSGECEDLRTSEMSHPEEQHKIQSETKERPVSPVSSCVSFKSDRSLPEPLNFTAGTSSVERTSKKNPKIISTTWTESIFKELEHKVITLLKNELNRFKKLLSADYPACSEAEEEDVHCVRESVLKITLHILKNMKQKDLTHTLQIKLASVYQRNLKSGLLNKCKRINEGISQQGTSTLLNQIFTELYVTESWTGDVNNEHEVRQIETASRRPATEETPIKCNELFKDKSIRTVLTKGVAGIGKTVSVQKFILDWAEEKANQDVIFMFPLPFRELNLIKQEHFSLMSLIHQFFPMIKDLEVIDSNVYKVLFIFDGLDECRLPLNFQKNEMLCDVTESASVDVLLTNLIKGNLLPSALLWITTRPGAANQIPPESVDQVTEVRGFNDPQKEEYFRKRISDQSLANKIIRHMKSSRSLYIMCHIPVFCWISATVLEKMLGEAESGEIPKTLAQMFTHFLIIQIKHKDQKYNQKDDPDPQKSRESIMALGKLAFHQLDKGNIMFYDEDLRECGIDVREVAVYSGVCTQIFRTESGLHLGKMFSFVHLSVQEFLAALYAFFCFIDKKQIKEQATDLSGLFNKSEMSDFLKGAVDQALQSDNGHLDLFLRFLLGLSVESNQKLIRGLLTNTGSSSDCQKDIVEYIKLKFEQNPSPERSINLFYCLNELNDDSLVKEIQSYMSSGRLSEAELSPAQWSALVFVLLTSEEDLEVFELQKFIRSDECFKRLLPVVQEATTVLLSECNLTERSCWSLHTVLSSESSKLTEVDLSSNPLEDSGVKQLCAGLKSPHCKLETLRLSDCSITEEGYTVLSEALKSSHLIELDLRGNDPGASGVKLLTDLLQDPDCKLNTLRLLKSSAAQEACTWLNSTIGTNCLLLKELDLSRNEPGDSGVKQLSALMEDSHCKFQIIKLNKCNLTVESCSALASALKFQSCSVRELDLSENSLQDSGVTQLSAGLKHQHCNLETLRLKTCDLMEESCSALAEVLSSEYSQLRELDLSENSLQDSGVTQLSAGLKNPQSALTILRLCNCSVTDEGCAALATALGENPSHLLELDLNGNKVGDSGIKQISNLLQNPHCILEKLRLMDNNISEEGYTALSEALKSSHLIELDLRGNDPGASGVKLLTDLRQDPDCKLNTLRLLKSSAAQEGCDLLSRVLGVNPLLQRELNVSEKISGDSQVKQLSALLEDSHCRPERLKVNNCRMTNEGCAALVSALGLNPSHLRELELSGNKLGGSGMKELCDVLKNQQLKLLKLGLYKCSLTEDDCTAVVAALRTNPSHLKELDLSDNTIGDTGVKQLCDLLKTSNCSLKKLIINNCNLTQTQCGDLAKALESNSSSPLKELELRGNYSVSGWNIFSYFLGNPNSKLILRILSPEAEKVCDYLTKVLGTNPLLQRELDLSGKISGDSGVKQLSVLLKDPQCRTEKLRLNKSSVTDRGFTDLISALTTNPSHLTELDLSENTLENSGAIQISTLLKNSSCKLQKLVLSDCNITEKGYTDLVKALKSNHSSLLIELDLRGNDPGASGIKELRDLMNDKKCKLKTLRVLKRPEAQKAFNHLTEVLGINPILQTDLNLSGKIKGDSEVEQLSVLLKDPHCRPERLQLSECNLTEKGCSALLTALRSEHSTLKELNLSNNRIQDSGVKLLSEELKKKHCKLETLRLSDCSITEEGYTFLAEALRQNSSSHLRELDLRGNDPGASGVKQLTDNKVYNLTLRLLKSPDAEEAYTCLTDMFSKNPLLHTELDLSTKTPKNIKVKQLSALLQDPHYRLQKLTLYTVDSMTDDDCSGVFSALVLNPSHLRDLNLNSNKPGESGLRNLCDFLKNPKCKLQTLKLQNSVKGKSSCADVASALCTNPSHIRELDLSVCELGDSGVKKLCDLLKIHECKLEKLLLYKCRITDGDAAALTGALRSNSSYLKQLNLTGNKLTDSTVKLLSEILKSSGGQLMYDGKAWYQKIW